ncbi:MAG: hypothetical protein LBP62_02165 [Clostridiales bacterium]|nr:hypothetical protein [Clostridiales bacterium]
MINKKDLRFVKTERLIEKTYIDIKRKTRAPVKVSELCAAALINKSTFYSHYETIDALDEHICMKEAANMLENCPDIDSAFTDTAVFVRSLVKTIQKNFYMTSVLFRNDPIRLLNLIETCLLKRYLHGGESPQTEMKIIFAIGGAARLLFIKQNEERINMAARLIKEIIDSKED